MLLSEPLFLVYGRVSPSKGQLLCHTSRRLTGVKCWSWSKASLSSGFHSGDSHHHFTGQLAAVPTHDWYHCFCLVCKTLVFPDLQVLQVSMSDVQALCGDPQARVSPLLCLSQTPSMHFLQPIKVQIPLPSGVTGTLGPPDAHTCVITHYISVY